MTYGIGHQEGVLFYTGQSDKGGHGRTKAVVVSSSIPWWLLVSARLHVNVIGVWFDQCCLFPTFLESYFSKEVGPSGWNRCIQQRKDAWLKELAQAQIVMLDCHPRSSETYSIWRSSKTRVIVCAEGSNRKPPPGWCHFPVVVRPC